MIGAVRGVLVQKGSKLEVDSETTLALLVLTVAASSEEARTGEAPAYRITSSEALHDVMKVSLLLPVVQKADAPYRGAFVEVSVRSQL